MGPTFQGGKPLVSTPDRRRRVRAGRFPAGEIGRARTTDAGGQIKVRGGMKNKYFWIKEENVIIARVFKRMTKIGFKPLPIGLGYIPHHRPADPPTSARYYTSWDPG